MAINIPITSEFNDKGLKAATDAFGGFGKSASSVSKIMSAALVPSLLAVAGGVLTFTKGIMPAITAASDLQENTSKIAKIFGTASTAIMDFSKTAAVGIGQSSNQVLEAAGTFGGFGKAAGLSGEALSDFTTDFLTLSADLASFNNTTPQEAIDAIGSALRGEAEPMRKFNVLMNDAALKAEAMKLGIYSGSAALTSQQKILAAQALIFKQTTDAQGDFADTSDGLANQQRILAAQFENVKTKIGEILLPAFKTFVTYLNERILPALDATITGFKEKGLSGAVLYFAAAMGDASIKVLNSVEGMILGFVNLEKGIVNFFKPGFAVIDLFRAMADAIAGGDGVITVEQMLLNRTTEVTTGFDRLRNSVLNTGNALNMQGNKISPVIDQYDKVGQKINAATKEVTGLIPVLEDVAKGHAKVVKETEAHKLAMKEAKEAAERLKDGLREAAKVLESEMAEALKNASKELETAQERFDAFENTVDGSIRAAVDFKAAWELGETSGDRTFGSALDEQLAKAENFAKTITKLRVAGLSESALQEVMKAGVEAGTAIGEELLKGQTNILKANKLMETLDAIAKETAKGAALQFYGAGVEAGKAYLKGVADAMAGAENAAQFAIMPADLKAVGAAFEESISTGTPFVSPIVVAGPPPEQGKGDITINVNGGMATSAQIGQSIYDNLLQFQQIYGPISLGSLA